MPTIQDLITAVENSAAPGVGFGDAGKQLASQVTNAVHELEHEKGISEDGKKAIEDAHKKLSGYFEKLENGEVVEAPGLGDVAGKEIEVKNLKELKAAVQAELDVHNAITGVKIDGDFTHEAHAKRVLELDAKEKEGTKLSEDEVKERRNAREKIAEAKKKTIPENETVKTAHENANKARKAAGLKEVKEPESFFKGKGGDISKTAISRLAPGEIASTFKSASTGVKFAKGSGALLGAALVGMAIRGSKERDMETGEETGNRKHGVMDFVKFGAGAAAMIASLGFGGRAIRV